VSAVAVALLAYFILRIDVKTFNGRRQTSSW